MTNGLKNGMLTVFINNGNIAYQGYNSKFSNKIFAYVKIDKVYSCVHEYNIEFKVTDTILTKFAEECEKAW